MIADYSHVHNIKYEYERPASDSSNGTIISMPDFYLPEYDIYVEYLEMVNTEGPTRGENMSKGCSGRWRATVKMDSKSYQYIPETT
ncbi:MAG TPA: hypothetical protein VNI77_09715 [Nitrososphaera sp.]|nr:hypothetical protein [Nitrososphaera sp.]